jgi:dipeptidyl aminopeptidase/acylaminoacyl peptidase
MGMTPVSMLKPDLCDTALYQEALALFQTLRQPGTGQISDAAEVHAAPNGTHAVFAGTLADKLEGALPTRICVTQLATGDTRVLTFGPNVDRLPKFSPDGELIAFLSDRHRAGDFQLYLLDPRTAAARPTPPVDGWVEYLHWSADGKRILLGVAGHGADVSGAQGAISSLPIHQDRPSWMPRIQSGHESYRWRRAWIYELATGKVWPAPASDLNLWEVVWWSNDALAAIASPGPLEGFWYSARLYRIELQTGQSSEVYRPKEQLGWPAASSSGAHLAFVEAVCSDRWIVAGDLKLLERSSGNVRAVETHNIDVSYTEWRSDRKLLVAGHRGFESVLALYDVVADTLAEVWTSATITTGGSYIAFSGVGVEGDAVLIGEGFARAPEVGVIREGAYRTVKSFDLGYQTHAEAIDAADPVSWPAPDGLNIDGWLLRPRASQRPYPLIVSVHGGPVGHSRPRWLGRSGASTLMLLKRGYAILFPNTRGSAGRGQSFVRLVRGDLGGAETADHLSGLDYLVDKGIADAKRLGVTGVSHGGFMTSWLITQSDRFAAAVAVAPINNFISEHLISNIPDFVAHFLADTYRDPTGKYFQRSPIMHAHKVKTPTLHICGALDRCTPPEEAVQFHNALLQNHVESVLITYPEEGHGIRKFPACIDFSARVVAWFDTHMPIGQLS